MPRVLSEQEFTAIKDRVLASLPNDLSPRDFQRMASSALAGAIAEAEQRSGPALDGSAVRRLAEGAWKNLNPATAIAGLWNTLPIPQAMGGAGVVSPVRALRDLSLAHVTQVTQAADLAKQGRMSEARGHLYAAGLPVLGPAAAQAGDRLGTGDVAGGVGEGLGLIAPIAAGPALRAGGAGARGALAAVRGTPAGLEAVTRLATLADEASTARIVEVGGPKVGANKVRLTNKLADVAPQLARAEGLSALSRDGLAMKVAAKLDAATAVLDDASEARLASQQVQTAPLLQQLDTEISKLTAAPVEASRLVPSVTSPALPTARPMGAAVEPGPNAAQLATLKHIRSEIAQLGPVASYEAMKRIRQAWDQVAKVKFLPSTAQDALASQGAAAAAVKGTGAIREALASADPTTAAANAEYSLYKNAHDVLQAALEADRARPRVLRGVLTKAGGAVAGAESGGAVGAGIGVILMTLLERVGELAPTTKILAARHLARVADLLRGGDAPTATTTLRQFVRGLPSKGQVVKATAVPAGRMITEAPADAP